MKQVTAKNHSLLEACEVSEEQVKPIYFLFGSSKVLKYFLYYCVLCGCGATVLSPLGTAGVWGVRNIGFQMEVKYLTTI